MTGIDTSTGMLEMARRRLGDGADLQMADLGSPLPFPDGAFDGAFAGQPAAAAARSAREEPPLHDGRIPAAKGQRRTRCAPIRRARRPAGGGRGTPAAELGRPFRVQSKPGNRWSSSSMAILISAREKACPAQKCRPVPNAMLTTVIAW